MMGIHRCFAGAALFSALALAGCASYNGAGLGPGPGRLDEVIRTMGEPAMRWSEPDGSQQLAYPRGPQGYSTFMVFVAPDGSVRRIENVLDERHFAAVKPDTTDRDAILRMFGPPREKLGFDRRNEET